MLTYETIDTPDSPKVAAYTKLPERKLSEVRESFVAEGETVLKVALSSPEFEVLSMFMSERQSKRLGPLLEESGVDVPVYIAHQDVMDAVVGFNIHRGTLAVVRRRSVPSLSEAIASGTGHVIVAMGIANHDNIGGIFRNAAAFGASCVLLDESSCHPFYRKAVRVSVGGVMRVPFVRTAAPSRMFEALAAAGIEPLTLSPNAERELSDIPRGKRYALVVGTEGPGLDAHWLKAGTPTSIRMKPGFDSLNVAQTVGIALYALG